MNTQHLGTQQRGQGPRLFEEGGAGKRSRLHKGGRGEKERGEEERGEKEREEKERGEKGRLHVEAGVVERCNGGTLCHTQHGDIRTRKTSHVCFLK
jgi:hypothetical protein